MKQFRFGLCVCVSILVVTLCAVGCGNSRSGSATSSSTAGSGSTDSSSSEQKTPQTLYWRGTTDTGETFYFMDDQITKTAEVLIVPSEEQDGEPFHAQGNFTLAADGTATITAPEETEESEQDSSRDREKDEPFVFNITDVNTSSLLIDAQEHGKATLSPITEEDHKNTLVAYGYAKAEEPSEEQGDE